MQASVKVMRSYDYCHFEVALTSDIYPAATPEDPEGTGNTLELVNDLRKQAAILVDEAVRQYKIAKTKERIREAHEYEARAMLAHIENIREKPDSAWTLEEAALMRAYADKTFWKDFEEDDYCYGEDAEREHHFSMLRKFQDTRIAG